MGIRFGLPFFPRGYLPTTMVFESEDEEGMVCPDSKFVFGERY